MATSRLLVQGIGDVTIVGFTDSSIVDPLTIQKIGNELFDLVEKKDRRKLVLDFSNVKFLSSTTLGMLITLKKKSDTARGKVVFCGVRSELFHVFKLTNLDRMFSFYPDESRALAGFDVHLA